MGCGSSQVFLPHHLRKNNKTTEFSPSHTSSSFSVVLEAEKAPRLKTSSEITDSFIFPLVTFCASKDKKVAKMLKWSRISSNKESFCPPPWSLNYWKNASLFMETDDTCLTVFQEIFLIGKNSKSSFLNTLLSETWFTLIVHIKYWFKESWVGHFKAEEQMIIQKLSKKDLKPLKTKRFQSSKNFKTKVTALRLMPRKTSKMFMKILKINFLLTMLNHQLLRRWFSFWVVQAQEKERKIYPYI